MNDRILELMSVTGTPEEIVAHIKAFSQQHGAKAVKQLERVVRQRERHNRYMDILDEDHGFDPRQESEITISESNVPVEHYDRELQEIIDSSRGGAILRCVDRCLWVYADRDQSKSIGQKIQQFQEAFTSASPASIQWLRQQFGEAESFAPVPVEGNLSCPEAVPLFLRELEPETVRDLLMGKLMLSVFLFLDWFELGRMFEEMGCELVWSSAKEGRRTQAKPFAQRRATFGERIARIRLPDGNFVEGLSKIYRILFEGIRPSTIAAQCVELLKLGPGDTGDAT